MTKRDLVKWLEKKKPEAIAKAERARDEAIAAAKEFEYKNIGFDDFLDDALPCLQEFIEKYGKFIDKVKTFDGMSMSRYNWKFGYSDFVARFSDRQDIRMNMEEAIHIDTERYRKIRDDAYLNRRKVESTYNTVIETVKNLPTAKDGIEYLKKLGFDISEIQPVERKKQLPATISVNVDVKYLLLNKEKEDAGTSEASSTN
jgi:hypothetical protein